MQKCAASPSVLGCAGDPPGSSPDCAGDMSSPVAAVTAATAAGAATQPPMPVPLTLRIKAEDPAANAAAAAAAAASAASSPSPMSVDSAPPSPAASASSSPGERPSPSSTPEALLVVPSSPSTSSPASTRSLLYRHLTSGPAAAPPPPPTPSPPALPLDLSRCLGDPRRHQGEGAGVQILGGRFLLSERMVGGGSNLHRCVEVHTGKEFVCKVRKRERKKEKRSIGGKVDCSRVA